MVDREGTLGPDYLSLGEAAEYLGVSIQTLRRWDSAKKLKAVRHPGNGYRYYNRADLEPFRLDYKRAEMHASAAGHLFQTANANIETNDKLRDPQRDSHRAVRDHFSKSSEPIIIQIPVGCGKTGVMATLPFGVADGRVLVIAPNTTIRDGVSEALDISNPKCFWNKRRVLADLSKGPYRAVLDGPDANIHDCTASHFVVTNIQQLASSADRWLPQFPPNFFDMILVDEGHHNAADSWRKVFERFPQAKVVSLTATPFRSDGKPLAGNVIYRYPYAAAMRNGYIKQIHSTNVAPSEIFFTYRNDSHRHTLQEVLELREEAWFRRGVALGEECNRNIVDASITRCQALRDATGVKHQIIAAACSVDHARQVRSLYEERGLKAREIYSEMDPDDQDKVLEALTERRIDCVVQVQMLGEGFDHPPLSVAAIFRPFRSLSAYVQFVGRIMRVIHEGETDHPDNHGWIVSHVGLSNDSLWQDFRDFDLDDQQVFKQWVSGASPEPGQGKGQPRRFDVGMQVQDEIVSHFIGQSFLDPDDDRVIEKILSQKIPGTPLSLRSIITPEALRQKLKEHQQRFDQPPRSIPVQPQNRRKAMRTRLNERTRSVAARVLKDLGLTRPGRQISKVIPSVRRQPNDKALYKLLSDAVNHRLGVPSGQRGNLDTTQCEQGLQELDSIADTVRNDIAKALEALDA